LDEKKYIDQLSAAPLSIHWLCVHFFIIFIYPLPEKSEERGERIERYVCEKKGKEEIFTKGKEER